MKINVTLIYWYCASWSLVGCGIPGCCTFGCHAFDNGDLDCGIPGYANVLGYNVMVSLIETQGLERPIVP